MKTKSAPQFAAIVRRYVGFYQSRGRDPDIEQAWLRVILTGALLVYATYVAVTEGDLSRGLRLAMGCAAVSMLCGVWMLVRFRLSPARTRRMRYFGICADLIPLTVGLWGAGEPGVPLVGLYIWVTVGNGFRFGPRYLMAAYWLSALCFGFLLVFDPFWTAHRGIGIGFGLVLASIPLYVLVLLSRITAQKDAAVELSNAKSRFVANVSHELRTPLTGVFAVYDLLKRRRLAPDERELVGSLGSAITTLRSSVDAVLQMSKLEAGAERSERRLFNLRYFLWQLDAQARAPAEAKRLAWSFTPDVDIPSAVVGDPSHLQHVLGNLINNALKFTHKGGVTLRAAPCAGGVRFEVADTGIGIPLDKQETLFERFVQVDDTATRRYGGTGLGTSIAHDLVLLMNGTIGVHSAPGQGSTFWVELPLAAPAFGEPLSAWPATRREILVVGREGDSDLASVESDLVALGLRPVVVDPRLEAKPVFDPLRYLAALLVLPVAEAATFATTHLQHRAGVLCPWLAITRIATPTQAAALLRSGAAALLPPRSPRHALHEELAALVTRSDLASDAEAMPVTARPLTILLADDNASNRILLARILTDAGHAVHSVGRGDDAFDRMAEGEIDFAILDLNMPDMSGPDVVKLYRAGETGTGKRLPVIILSADATPAAQQESLDAGANDYLTKPVTGAGLLAAIERIMAGAAVRETTSVTPVVREAAPAEATQPRDVAEDASAPLLVDPDRIEALQRIARQDRDFLRRYTQASFQDLDSAMDELRGAMSAGDVRSARDALHKIDGTSASLGAAAMAAGAHNMRNYLSGSPDSDAAAALAELATTCALTKSAVTALLDERSVEGRNRR